MGRTLRGILSDPLAGPEGLNEGGALMNRGTHRLAEALQLFGYVAAGIGAAIDFRGNDQALGSAAPPEEAGLLDQIHCGAGRDEIHTTRRYGDENQIGDTAGG